MADQPLIYASILIFSGHENPGEHLTAEESAYVRELHATAKANPKPLKEPPGRLGYAGVLLTLKPGHHLRAFQGVVTEHLVEGGELTLNASYPDVGIEAYVQQRLMEHVQARSAVFFEP